MKLFRGHHHAGIAPGCALTIGNFDGLHLGHQRMIGQLRNEAVQRGLPTCVLTFEPHPKVFFARRSGRPDLAPARVLPLRDKLELLRRSGVDQVVVLPFNERIAAMSAEFFIEDVIHKGLGARYVLVGDDFRFGAKRAGDFGMLQSFEGTLGYEAARMASQELDGVRVSSTVVRDALSRGDLVAARAWLGRPLAISGRACVDPRSGAGAVRFGLRVRGDRMALRGMFRARLTTPSMQAFISRVATRHGAEQAGRGRFDVWFEGPVRSFDSALRSGDLVHVEFLEAIAGRSLQAFNAWSYPGPVRAYAR
jgi:riboflavin kinase/FMN adenylyltransferase